MVVVSEAKCGHYVLFIKSQSYVLSQSLSGQKYGDWAVPPPPGTTATSRGGACQRAT